MQEMAERYQDWKAPSQDGAVLVWPGAKQFFEDTGENQRRLRGADAVRVGGVALSEVREHMRGWLGHREADRPIIATGHQSELYHAGVWVKNAVIDAAA